MIREALQFLFGGPLTPAQLRRRADRLRDASFAHLERSKVLRGQARLLDDRADDLEFGPRARLPRAHAPRLGEGDQSNGQPP